MKYQQYKRVIEREHRMGLKKVMHHICVEEGLNAIEGEKNLELQKKCLFIGNIIIASAKDNCFLMKL